MDTVELKRFFPQGAEAYKRTSKEDSSLLPWLFRHHGIVDKIESAPPIDQKTLINTINYVHFMKGHVFVYLSHPKYEDGILIKSHPEPCTSSELACQWIGNTVSKLDLENYSFQYILIADGKSLILATGLVKQLHADGIVIQLPEKSYNLCQRRVKRFVCDDIHAEIIQNSVLFNGTVADFSPLAFCVRVRTDASTPFSWFNLGVPTFVNLRKGGKILFSGACRCIRQEDTIAGRVIVLAPMEDQIRRFKEIIVRNPRLTLTPTPVVTFEHPFFGKIISREISDISNTGFSVIENISGGVLMPGMIIPDLTIKYAGALEMKCKVQVIYRKEDDDTVRCGLAILDMKLQDFSNLTQLLNNTKDHHNYISGRVDMDALWEFFFDTGFIYPKKYDIIRSYRNDFKETYRKLYQETPEIARHFTYEKDGQIYGHMSMVRAYEQAWLIHHHAARPMENKLPGLYVLKQMMLFVHGVNHMPSAKMEYVMCYYRPDNKFPDRTFGGFARNLEDTKGCSLDLFCYVNYQTDPQKSQLPMGWSLDEISPIELWELDNFYQHHSGGLLMSVLGLGEKRTDEASLEAVSKRQGFVRKWRAYSLVHRGTLKAVLIANHSDLGVNLSELLNCIMVIVVEPDGTPWQTLTSALSMLSGHYTTENIPVIVYPPSYMEEKNISYDKHYQQWILNLQYGDQFMDFMQRKFRMRL